MNMIEKVARALVTSSGLDPDQQYGRHGPEWKLYVDNAKAAIEAMREPTPEMLVSEDIHWGYSCHVCGGLKSGYETMIDAALKEE